MLAFSDTSGSKEHLIQNRRNGSSKQILVSNKSASKDRKREREKYIK